MPWVHAAPAVLALAACGDAVVLCRGGVVEDVVEVNAAAASFEHTAPAACARSIHGLDRRLQRVPIETAISCPLRCCWKRNPCTTHRPLAPRLAQAIARVAVGRPVLGIGVAHPRRLAAHIRQRDLRYCTPRTAAALVAHKQTDTEADAADASFGTPRPRRVPTRSPTGSTAGSRRPHKTADLVPLRCCWKRNPCDGRPLARASHQAIARALPLGAPYLGWRCYPRRLAAHIRQRDLRVLHAHKALLSSHTSALSDGAAAATSTSNLMPLSGGPGGGQSPVVLPSSFVFPAAPSESTSCCMGRSVQPVGAPTCSPTGAPTGACLARRWQARRFAGRGRSFFVFRQPSISHPVRQQ